MKFSKKHNTLLIVGKGGSKDKAYDTMVERGNNIPVWTLNDNYTNPMSEIEQLHFEIHDPVHFTNNEIIANYKAHVENFNETKLQIVRHSDYPMEEIINHFGVNYLANCIAYQLALAIYLKYDKIIMVGIDHFLNPTLGANERKCVEFWIGVAIGRDISVQLASTSTLFKRETDELIRNYVNGMKIGEGKKVDDEYLNRPDNIYK